MVLANGESVATRLGPASSYIESEMVACEKEEKQIGCLCEC